MSAKFWVELLLEGLVEFDLLEVQQEKSRGPKLLVRNAHWHISGRHHGYMVDVKSD